MTKAIVTIGITTVLFAEAIASPALAEADNSRFNNSVVQAVSITQHHAGCPGTVDVKTNRQLVAAAQRHADDLMNNRGIGGDIGSDGSSVQQRAADAGFAGSVTETVAIHPAIAMSGIDLMNLWYQDPAAYAAMADCGHSQIGVWSENSVDRTVVVAVYGTPGTGSNPAPGATSGIDPSPDYDASDEIEYFFGWLPWGLRGNYPPPAYPPS